MKKCDIGGQGVLEGVMMRAPSMSGLAVRKKTGEIVYEKQSIKPATEKSKFLKLPIIRGVVTFVEMLGFGVKIITRSAKLYDELADTEPSKFEKYVAKKTGKDAMDIAMVFAVILSIGLAVGLFFILPNVLASLVTPLVGSAVLKNLIEGVIRIIIFVLYIVGVSFLGEIKRVFRYHGAEHKTINCYEHEEPLTVENIQKYKTLHPRCGTSYLLLVMVISILLFSLLGWNPSWFLRIGLRLLMLPVVAGVSYEFLKFAAKGDSLFFRIIRWPGMMLQKLTTAEPDDSMVEVAIVAFRAAMDDTSDEELAALANSFYREPEEAEVVKAQETAQETQTDQSV